ncbi:transposase [Desulfosporosinus acidiphilus SJ4]|uniref:Transposase n=1 Tax=Desulfosporosinus acidiphilus (strain DSM 22704 / JCM 16185 / SJ4) TaxID=646529 RepID=I4DAU8_DESAJ|nr:IS110 family transposase [Desulfosporosinus acidiphilus]AFM42922.1 transposase [Desulfosporosinus acidiphilus SJ4]
MIGVDIGHETQHARAFDWRGVELGKVFRFENSKEGFEAFGRWVEKLKHSVGKTAVMVGSEPTGHYWFNLVPYLKESGMKLVLVNPHHVKKSKEMDDNHPSKTDRKDPKTIAKLVCEGRYNIPHIPEGVYAELRIMMELRLRVCKELNQIKNRVQRWLSIYFPEFVKVYCKIDTVSGLLVLENVPMPEDILALGAAGLNGLWRQSKIKAVGMKKATSLFEAAKSSVGCKNGGDAARLELRLLLADYRTKMEQYTQIMEEVEKLCRQVPNVEKLLEIGGIGFVTVAGFVVEVGDIRRFQSPKQIQKLAGLALRENSSGQCKGQTTISRRGRARLRAVLFQAVMPLVSKNQEFKKIHQYYTSRAKNPLKKKQSLIALSCKLIRVFYALLTKGCAYDPVKLVTDINRPVDRLAA